ncbi:hypothetical protein FLAN108750_09555 [Flavobacterium antarcticum]
MDLALTVKDRIDGKEESFLFDIGAINMLW